MFKKIGDFILCCAFILILAAIVLSLLKSCNKDNSNVIDTKQKSIDSLNVLYQKSLLKVDGYESDLKSLNKELLVAQNTAQISETKYYQLKNRKVKPIYIENVNDCNDTIQSIYKYSVEKDSLCNSVISAKNLVIRVQDTIIKDNDSIKGELKNMLSLKNGEVQANKNIIEYQSKEIKKQKLIKNGYKLGVVALIVKMLFFK